MNKFLTLKRSVFVVAFLALVGMGTLWGGSGVHVTAQNGTLDENDLAYVESNTTFAISSGSYYGSQVTFGLDGVSATQSTVSNTMVAADAGYETAAGCVAEGLSEGAANASSVSIDTSGYSLPLQSDAYLPVNISGTYSGTDVYAETSFSGTVLAHAGFSTTNPDFEMSDTSTSVGVAYDDGGGGGGPYEYQQLTFLNGSGSYFMPATIMPASFLFRSAAKDKDKNYRLSFSKTSGTPSITGGKVRKWKSNVPGTENLDDVGLAIDSTAIQYDALSGTLNVKQKFHLKKAKKK